MVVQLLNLSDLSSDAKNALIFRLLDDFQQFHRTVKSLRKPSGKSPGGQKGHPGTRLERTETPDHTVVHPVKQCQKCGEPLEKIPVSSKEPGRQVIE